MLETKEMSTKCLECDKYYRSRPIPECPVCRNLEFEEGILCDLNRAVQESPLLVCHAFRPRLKLMSPIGDRIDSRPVLVDRKSRHKSIQEIMASDKFKYQKALALQKLKENAFLQAPGRTSLFAARLTAKHQPGILNPGIDHLDRF